MCTYRRSKLEPKCHLRCGHELKVLKQPILGPFTMLIWENEYQFLRIRMSCGFAEVGVESSAGSMWLSDARDAPRVA